MVGLTALLPWRREPRERPLAPGLPPTDAAQDPGADLTRRLVALVEADQEHLAESADAEPLAADPGDMGTSVEGQGAGKVDRRRARRDRRRNARQSDPATAVPDAVLVDPAAAVVADPEPEPVPEPEIEAEPVPEPEIEAEPVDVRISPEADLTLHAVEVPPDAPAEFVRDFLMDVQRMVHGGVPTEEQVEAADARAGADWLPAGWVLDQDDTTTRRATTARSLPAVRPPSVPQRRRARTPGRRTRLVRYAVVVVLIGGAAALPWVAPAVPDWFVSAIPANGPSPKTTDPTIVPAPTPSGPVPTPSPEPDLATTQLAAAGRPLEVWVPRLQVRAPVLPISGQSGTLLPPEDAQVLGWWQEGRGAGAKNGSAVVTGHTVSTGGGAFDNLGQLTVGDRLRVRTALGWITYAVQSSQDYSVAALAENAAEIFELDGAGRLVLITCSDFNGEVYLSNAVVVAIPVGDEPFDAAEEPAEEVPDGGLQQPWDEPTGNTGATPGVQVTEKPF